MNNSLQNDAVEPITPPTSETSSTDIKDEEPKLDKVNLRSDVDAEEQPAVIADNIHRYAEQMSDSLQQIMNICRSGGVPVESTIKVLIRDGVCNVKIDFSNSPGYKAAMYMNEGPHDAKLTHDERAHTHTERASHRVRLVSHMLDSLPSSPNRR